MSWKEDFLSALDAAKLFEDSGHRTRFKELMDCYAGYPFFTKGLCKCIYLSAWDEEHFMIMLETLTDMTLGRERDTDEMLIKGDALAEEQVNEEMYVYQLSIAFLEEKPFHLDEHVKLSEPYRYIIDQAQKAAIVIDSVNFNESSRRR
ncbi:MAG: hypothetical protein MR868_04865 [Lachnospiraceae bacterium]|nr:hypothetical protein [Lachnospiraceae bacterium]